MAVHIKNLLGIFHRMSRRGNVMQLQGLLKGVINALGGHKGVFRGVIGLILVYGDGEG
jgi:hypothetical protein